MHFLWVRPLWLSVLQILPLINTSKCGLRPRLLRCALSPAICRTLTFIRAIHGGQFDFFRSPYCVLIRVIHEGSLISLSRRVACSHSATYRTSISRSKKNNFRMPELVINFIVTCQLSSCCSQRNCTQPGVRGRDERSGPSVTADIPDYFSGRRTYTHVLLTD